MRFLAPRSFRSQLCLQMFSAVALKICSVEAFTGGEAKLGFSQLRRP